MKTSAALIEQPIQTAEGVFHALYSSKGLAALRFPSGRKSGKPAAASRQVDQWHRLTCRAVARVLEAKDPGEMPPLDLSSGTGFQQQVWKLLARLKPGQTLHYSEVAARIGKPRAARAAGGACGANPVPLLIPCHRILAAGGKLGGFSGGLSWKKRLLTREGVAWKD